MQDSVTGQPGCAYRFIPCGRPNAGHWVRGLSDWAPSAEDALLSAEVNAVIWASIDALPAGVAMVITLRDIEGWSADEVCRMLDISESNQRVRLHRARSRVRADLEHYLADATTARPGGRISRPQRHVCNEMEG